MLLLRIIVGIIGIIAGTTMVWRPLAWLDIIGKQNWMMKVFGEYVTGYKVFGIIVIIVSMLIMTGLVQGLLLWFLGPIFPN
jgi:hypothetical protein